MLRALATGELLSFPNAKGGECVAAVDSVATRCGLNCGVSNSSQLCIAAHLIVCKEAIVAVTQFAFAKLSVTSFRASGVRMSSRVL
jgi:hypothetical protein